jgi:hypothetical protein
MNAKGSDKPLQVFISYSHADRHWLERLQVHLSPLGEGYDVDMWDDTRLRPGSRWREEIRVAVEKADVAILLVSADFLASDFIRRNELPPLLQAAEEEGLRVLPVILCPSFFLKTPELSRFTAVNDPATPVISMPPGDREAVFLSVAEAVLESVSALTPSPRNDDANAGAQQEVFLNHATWARLIKIGDWIFDEDGCRIMGSGMHAYLLSRAEFGHVPFVIHTSLEFSNFVSPQGARLGMNSGIVFGWKQEGQSPRYYNIKLSGDDLQLERVGFGRDKAYRDFEHITQRIPLKIQARHKVEFAVQVDLQQVKIFANGTLVESIDRPTGVVGRVGLRPWRSKMDCTQFVVSEERSAVEQLHTADGVTRRS